MTPLRVGRAELDRAVFLASKLAIIDHQGEDWRRLRRAIDALMRGTAEPGLQDERLHQFVRSLEGLIRPDIARTRAQFIHRSQTFALANSSAVKALEHIFDIRSKIEHLHSPLAMLSGSTTAENQSFSTAARAKLIDWRGSPYRVYWKAMCYAKCLRPKRVQKNSGGRLTTRSGRYGQPHGLGCRAVTISEQQRLTATGTDAPIRVTREPPQAPSLRFKPQYRLAGCSLHRSSAANQ